LKRCRYCRRLFKPDPRTEYEQRVCSGAECQKQRKRDYQKKWCEKNPTYFHGQYPRVKQWLDEHPGYLKKYRRNKRKHPGTYNKKKKRRKAVSLPELRSLLETRVVEIEQIFRNLPCGDIQVAIEARNPDLKPFCSRFTHG